MDKDNSVVIAGEEKYKGAKWSWKKYNKDQIKKDYFLFIIKNKLLP